MVQAMIRPLVWVVLLGYLMMWIMMPTNTYRDVWIPDIISKVNSTYFGTQGAELLLYTFPILFVAALGCVHLHLGRRSDGNYNKLKRMNRFSAWCKKPMLVKGPLGIVSGMELAFLVMFAALLIWSLSTYIRNFFAFVTPQFVAMTGEKAWEAKLGMVAVILGIIGNIGLTLLFFPVARGSSVLPLFGLTSEASIKYHIWLGHMVMTFFTAHGIAYIIYWALTNRISETLKWAKTGISNVAGEISLVAGLGLWATTFPRVRTKMFELFFYTHYLYILFMAFFIFHVGISYSFIMLPGFYLFLIDRYLRFLQSRQRVRLVSARILPCETLELNFSKTSGLRYSPTSILFMNVPCISRLQWHPFTINSSSNLESDRLSVVIKGEGSWSKKLYQIVSSPSQIDRLEVSIEGPYGPASTHFLRHDTLVMVSGGSGIAPFISIIRDLISTGATDQNCKTPKVLLVCAFKNSSDLTVLDLLLPLSGNPSTVSSLQLKIEAYVTREKQPTSDHSKLVRTKWFKPHENDEPMYPLLGRNSWLYLGAIISSTFIIFLIIIGLITRYYIYPIDHNTDIVFSLSLRAFLYMLVMCVCIAVTASAAVMWNKRTNAREAKQIQNMEVPTPAGSSESGSYHGDRELESQPHQSLVQATNVHYGQRPDLKKILSECRGSTVGVLTCGPKKLRHDVASICGSGVADNLHFESISFSW